MTDKLEIIDLEEFSKSNKKPPRCKHYKIKVDRDKFVVEEESKTGREILELAGKIPATQYQLRQNFEEAQSKKLVWTTRSISQNLVLKSSSQFR